MINFTLTEEENKLCELYQRTKDQNILLEIYNKINVDICNLIYYKINKKIYSSPLEHDDLKHIIWKSLKSTIDEYSPDCKNEFISWIIRKSYQTTIREVRKFLTNGEVIMNNVISLDGALQRNKYFESQTNNIDYVTKSYKDSFEDISQFVLDHIYFLDKNDVKRVIYLKSLGYKNTEIEKKLSFPRRYVRKIIDTVKMIGKRY